MEDFGVIQIPNGVRAYAVGVGFLELRKPYGVKGKNEGCSEASPYRSWRRLRA